MFMLILLKKLYFSSLSKKTDDCALLEAKQKPFEVANNYMETHSSCNAAGQSFFFFYCNIMQLKPSEMLGTHSDSVEGGGTE